MKRFVESIKKSVEEENWYSALSLTPIMPDICSNLENPNTRTKWRYIEWFNEYVKIDYLDMTKKVQKLSGVDCYALRCIYIHQGDDDTDEQSISNIFKRFEFEYFKQEGQRMSYSKGDTVFLQVNSFCRAICDGVEDWMKKMEILNIDFYKKYDELMIVKIKNK